MVDAHQVRPSGRLVVTPTHSWSCWQVSPTRAGRSLRPQSLSSGDEMEIVVVVVVEVCLVCARTGTGSMQVGGVFCPGTMVGPRTRSVQQRRARAQLREMVG